MLKLHLNILRKITEPQVGQNIIETKYLLELVSFGKMSSESESPPKYPRKTRPKISGNFSEEDTIKLINYVKKMPVIWNTNHKEYAEKKTRNTAWSLIYKQFGGRHHESDLRTKWNNLRIQYRITLGKLKGKGEGNASVWRHFAALKFLENDSKSETLEARNILEPEDELELGDVPSSARKSPKKRRTRLESEDEPELATVLSPPSKRLNDSKGDPNLQLCNYMYSELTELKRKMLLFFEGNF
ncbi:uncharacterized protein LOC110187913 isoform X1 [Drosophila serrata]|uniref:uncharacterized protein LOC110187913 isoform X1 n=1 Tax=Drosophila serrata TaxID=7274 RepID=UPI000A1D2CC2|nr:uncharacterized protein LOC110187913 isoform X1 [Drosophila serrata]